jgi:hypothetical protein
MATRAIVTSQPVLACDMCGRRLLRGERPETFRVGREPRIVCELCAPRASFEGWQREADFDASLMLGPSRRRRGGSLLGRLRQLREPVQRPTGREPDSQPREHDLWHEPHLHQPHLHDPALHEPGPHEPDARERDLSDEALEGWVDAPAGASSDDRGSGMQRALGIFNLGEHPRRIGGVARSLGTPAVTIRPIEGSPSRFTIVVAWELCWYRYEVDVEDEPAGARLVEKGMELAELPAEDRAANAAADDRGELAIAA